MPVSTVRPKWPEWIQILLEKSCFPKCRKELHLACHCNGCGRIKQKLQHLELDQPEWVELINELSIRNLTYLDVGPCPCCVIIREKLYQISNQANYGKGRRVASHVQYPRVD